MAGLEHFLISVVADMKGLGHLLVPLILIVSIIGLYLSGDIFDELGEKVA